MLLVLYWRTTYKSNFTYNYLLIGGQSNTRQFSLEILRLLDLEKTNWGFGDWHSAFPPVSSAENNPLKSVGGRLWLRGTWESQLTSHARFWSTPNVNFHWGTIQQTFTSSRHGTARADPLPFLYLIAAAKLVYEWSSMPPTDLFL